MFIWFILLNLPQIYNQIENIKKQSQKSQEDIDTNGYP